MEYYELQYSANPPQNTAWYACFNIVLCMGSLIERYDSVAGLSPGFNFEGSTDVGWLYLRNACSCFVDLVFKERSSLMTVQALCGIVSCAPLTNSKDELLTRYRLLFNRLS